MEPPISPLMQNQEKKVGVMDPNFALRRLDFLRFWDPAQNLGRSSRFCGKHESMAPIFFSKFFIRGLIGGSMPKIGIFVRLDLLEKKFSLWWGFLGIFRKKAIFAQNWGR